MLTQLAIAIAPVLAPAPVPAPAPQGTPIPGNIVEVAQQNGNFTTLVTALQLTGLDAALDGSSGAARFTVFAPTDAAFAALDPALLAALIADPAALSEVLLYHVTSGGLLASNVLASLTIDMLNGQRTDISLPGGVPFIDQAEIEITDVVCSNGVIHVIDAVLIPATDNLVETAVMAPDARYLTHLLGFTSLIPTLESGEFTVFAPTNVAFQQLPAASLRGLVTPTGVPTLESILLIHVVPGRLYADEVVAAGQLTSVGGKVLPVTTQGTNVFVDGALVLLPDIETSNGNIHFIDMVLMP
ncbi:MAG: fasciclin domain-containing protein [Planctomycetota bacterium]